MTGGNAPQPGEPAPQETELEHEARLFDQNLEGYLDDFDAAMAPGAPPQPDDAQPPEPAPQEQKVNQKMKAQWDATGCVGPDDMERFRQEVSAESAPPEPAPYKIPRERMDPITPEELAAWTSPAPPQPVPQRKCERCPPGVGCNESDVIDRSPPPQPGDAENAMGAELARIWADALEANSEMSIVEITTVSGDDVVADLRALAGQFDAAQSALAESRRDNQILERVATEWRDERDDSRAEVARLKAEAQTLRNYGINLEDEIARLRSPTATKGEVFNRLHADPNIMRPEDTPEVICGRLPAATDIERAREIVEAFPSYAFDRAHTETLVQKVAAGLAETRLPAATGEDAETFVRHALRSFSHDWNYNEGIKGVIEGVVARDAAARANGRASLFVAGEFTAHSGNLLPYKIECDALTDEDLATLAAEVARRLRFSSVYGVPRGGRRFADALALHRSPDGPLLIADDVLTTGASMEEVRSQIILAGTAAQPLGIVIFARGPCPDWVTPLFGDVAAARAQGRREACIAAAEWHAEQMDLAASAEDHDLAQLHSDCEDHFRCALATPEPKEENP